MTERNQPANTTDTDTEIEEFEIEMDYDGLEEPSSDSPPKRTSVFTQNEVIPCVLTMYADKAGSGIPDRRSIKDIALPFILDHAHFTAMIAQHVVLQARRMLHRGPLNQLLPLDDPEYPEKLGNGKTPPAYVCGEASPKYLNQANDSLSKALSEETTPADPDDPGGQAQQTPRTPFEHLLARFYTTALSGCGVCSDFSALTTGLLTMFALPERRTAHSDFSATILRVSHSFDHSFTLFSYGMSPWFVVDPWVMEPYIVPLEKNIFDHAGISSFTRIDVFDKLDDPFGIPSMSVWKEGHLETDPVGFLSLTNRMIGDARRMWEQKMAALDAGHGLLDAHPANKTNGIVKKVDGRWRGDPLARWKVADGVHIFDDDRWHNFHLDHVWGQLSNHAESRDEASYGEFRKKQRPAAYGTDWGGAVG